MSSIRMGSIGAGWNKDPAGIKAHSPRAFQSTASTVHRTGYSAATTTTCSPAKAAQRGHCKPAFRGS